MIRFLFSVILAVFTMRFLLGLAHFAAGLLSRGPRPTLDPGSDPAPKSIVDRASAIDVPFTEESSEP